jgi:spoIIIJ-associated protein
MKKFAETSAKSIEEAVAAALHELGAEPGDVDIEVLDEGNKGILGFIGSKSARVRVTLKQYDTIPADDMTEHTIDFLADVFNKMTRLKTKRSESR